MRGSQAIKAAARQDSSRWTNVSARIGKGLYLPKFQPKFKLQRKPVFAIGSCFAQEVQTALGALGFLCVSLLKPDHEELFLEKVGSNYAPGHQHFLHRFNPASFMQEIDRIFDDEHPLNHGSLLVETRHGYLDCHYRTQFAVGSWEEALRRRQIIRAQMKEITTCGVFIMTLGFTESWFDHRAGLYLNSPPPLSSVDDRYEFGVLSTQDSKTMVEKAIATVRKNVSGIRFVLTVSPIPLEVTLSGRDVGVANSRSKSTLVAAANEIMSESDDVDYFPSYEIATLSRRDAVWAEDGRHVRSAVVGEIMNHFVNSYF